MRRIGLYLLNTVALLLATAAVFYGAASLYSRHLDFPARWHPDEPGKIYQLMTGERNYYHPQLMLEGTLLLGGHDQIDPKDRDAWLQTGRRMSGYFSAGAAALLMVAGFFAAGWPGAVLVALSTALCPPLLAHSRYLKEEPALIFGIAAVIAAAAAMARCRRTPALIVMSILVGFACGIAASGKYVGLVMVGPGLLIVAATTWRRWWLPPVTVVLMLAAGAATWAGINHRAIDNWEDFKDGFEYERRHALEDTGNVTMAQPNLYFVDIVWDDAMPHIKVLVILAPIALLLMRRRGRPDRVRLLPDQRPLPYHRRLVWPGPPVLLGWWLVFTIVYYTAALSWSVIPFYRYALPVSVMLHVLGGLGAVWIARWLSTRRVPAVAIGGFFALVIGGWQYARCADFDNQFVNDSRVAVGEWAKTNLPPRLRVVADNYVDRHINRRESNTGGLYFAGDFGSPAELKSRGVRYVAIVGTNYERFLSPHTIAAEGQAQRFYRREAFYRELFAKYPIVWQRRAEHPMRTFTNPDIFVFRIGEKKDGQP